MINNELIGELLKTPLSLLVIKDQATINQLNSIIPYSTGFEIECDKSPIFDTKNFTNIPDIIDVNCDSTEQRYRIPNGLKGIICLYNICDQLRYNSLLNPASGIHYHIDATYKNEEIQKVTLRNKTWILNELDSWEYKGTYNARDIGIGSYWIRLNSLKTLEFRLGDMSFNFNYILKRISHCNSIVRRVKDQIEGYPKPEYEVIDAHKIIAYRKSLLLKNTETMSRIGRINDKITEMNKKLIAYDPINDLAEIQSKYRNRLHRINRPSK